MRVLFSLTTTCIGKIRPVPGSHQVSVQQAGKAHGGLIKGTSSTLAYYLQLLKGLCIEYHSTHARQRREQLFIKGHLLQFPLSYLERNSGNQSLLVSAVLWMRRQESSNASCPMYFPNTQQCRSTLDQLLVRSRQTLSKVTQRLQPFFIMHIAATAPAVISLLLFYILRKNIQDIVRAPLQQFDRTMVLGSNFSLSRHTVITNERSQHYVLVSSRDVQLAVMFAPSLLSRLVASRIHLASVWYRIRWSRQHQRLPGIPTGHFPSGLLS